jgi:hypothetical protein
MKISATVQFSVKPEYLPEGFVVYDQTENGEVVSDCDVTLRDLRDDPPLSELKTVAKWELYHCFGIQGATVQTITIVW